MEFADKVVTEITCHAKGGQNLAGDNCSIIDVGGQDTKSIQVRNGMVADFLMNDKCSAGTGKFIEIMANRLGISIDELFELDLVTTYNYISEIKLPLSVELSVTDKDMIKYVDTSDGVEVIYDPVQRSVVSVIIY